ncbi:MAG TPA: haloacid dehalogenase type II [Euzebya sp.]|nr:haloacid dehalogenase type II [Euzebya sp.]
MDARVLVFDVNETLLDLSALDPAFAGLFGDPAARREWFAQVLQSAMVSVATGVHRDFGTIGRAALMMTAARHDLVLRPEEAQAVLDGMRRLPPHPEVLGALTRLRDAGLRLATLTNSPPATAEAQLANAGLTDLFEARLSVEGAGVLKPAPQVYAYAADQLGVVPSGIRLVAAHAWDVTGAIRAGCAAAFVARPGMVLDPSGEEPDIIGADLDVVTDLILRA